MTQTDWLYQNNNRMMGGGNVKQGLVPQATAFFGMRLKTNLNHGRNNLSGNQYPGVQFYVG